MKRIVYLSYVFVCIILLTRCENQIICKKFKGTPIDDDRVMLQGFYWESYRFGHLDKFPEVYPGNTNINKYWYEIVMEKAPEIKAARFDLIWLPPCTKGSGGAGYSPTELFNPGNMYGDSVMHHELLKTLWNNGVEPIGDIVINHRNGTGSWAGFSNPSWSTKSICYSDEAFSDTSSEVYNLPDSLRGNKEEIVPYDPKRERAYAYDSFRDLDHTSDEVKKDIIRALLFYKSFGYRGWRYDMVHGYHAKHIRDYNKITCPSFTVGEFDWDDQDAWRGWIWESAVDTATLGEEHFKTAASVFDFTTHFSLEKAIGSGCNNFPNYDLLYGYGNGLGLMGDNTDNLPWKCRSVTFLENHDTGWRTNEDGSNEKDHDFDSFENNWQVEQGYAYILTHPGVPCVFWKHYFDWGSELHDKIKALINARKVAGVHSNSTINMQNNARNNGVYAAMIEGKSGELYVRIGGNDSVWNPSLSGYSDYKEYVYGNGWKVWIHFDTLKNNEYQFFPLNDTIPDFPKPIDISELVF